MNTLFSNDYQGVLLVFEYTWFLLQQTKNAGNDLSTLIDFSIKSYQTSGTQTTVLNALQSTIEEHADNDDYDIMASVIIGIIHKHRMCKWMVIKAKI